MLKTGISVGKKDPLTCARFCLILIFVILLMTHYIRPGHIMFAYLMTSKLLYVLIDWETFKGTLMQI